MEGRQWVSEDKKKKEEKPRLRAFSMGHTSATLLPLQLIKMACNLLLRHHLRLSVFPVKVCHP